jgi:hypothetical protein
MKRNLYRRMEQLEARLTPGGERLIIDVQFISAVDKSVVGWIPGASRAARASEAPAQCLPIIGVIAPRDIGSRAIRRRYSDAETAGIGHHRDSERGAIAVSPGSRWAGGGVRAGA